MEDNNTDNDGSIGGWDNDKAVDLSLQGVPTDWEGWTRSAKVQHLLSVVQDQLQKVRSGTFNPSKGERVSALALEGLLELADFYADAEANAKNAKHIADYTESEKATAYAERAASNDVRVSEASIKRVASISDEVKDAKKSMVELEKEYKKWRYVYETLKEAHIFFRNIDKL